MFNFFKKTKSKDNSSSKANNKNKKGKQTDAPSFLTRKNNTKQESESNNLACEALKSLRITTETVGCVEPEVMGNTESKSQASSPGLNKIGGKESLEHSASSPTVVNSARAEFSHVDKNSNGIIEKADCSPSTSTSSPTVSDLLRGINSDESALNERSKKESTPDSDVIFKTAPNTPVLSRENLPRQITVPAELPSIVEDFKHMERNLEQDENISENTDKNKMKDNNLNTIAPDSDKKNTDFNVETSVSNDEKTLIDSRFHSDCSNKENGSILDGEQNYVASNLNLYQNVSPDIGTSFSQDESISDISQQSKVKHSNVVNNGDQVSSFENSSEFNKIPDSDSISEFVETKSSRVNHSQESTGDIKNEYSQEPESSSDVSEVRLTQNKLENYVSEEKFNARVDTVTIDCSKVDSDPSLPNCDELLVKLITDFPDNHSQTLKLGDGERFVCKQSKESTGECAYDETSVENVTSVERSNSGDHSMGNSCSNEVSVCIPMRKNDEDSNSVDNSIIDDSCSNEVSVCIPMRKNDEDSNCVDNSIVYSCSNEVSVCIPMKNVDEDSNYDDHSIVDSCSNKVVCISIRENDAAKVEGKQFSEESDSRCESIQSDGSALSEGNQGPSEAEDEQIETLAENVCEVENLCPVEKLAENNNNGCFTERERTAKADLQRGGIENLPKIIIESVEEHDSGFARLEENKTEENCGEIYGDESSSEEEDDSEEPLTVMEKADYLLDNAKKSEDSDEAESPACVRDTAAHEEMLDTTKEHLVNAEKRAEKQMAELKTELEDSEKEMFRMRIQVQDLQRESIAKTGGMERLQAELSAAYKESEFVRRKLKRLEEELANFKQKNSDLTEELSKKAEIENENDYWKVMELENEAKELTRRVKELEALLSTTRAERDDLKKRVDELLAESEEERKLAQEALDEAMAEKIAMQEKYEREFEKLRSANIDREQKMLDDFEWKLREVEQACKKRLDDKEQTSKQQVREVEGKLTVAEGKLAQLPHLKQCEQELNHLRERSIETQRSLRTATRQLEQLQDSDKQQHEEIQQLKQLLEKEKSHLTTVQSIHYRELAEKDRKLQFKLDQQKTEINSEWEDKMRRETQRIKTESDRHHRTEKLQALDEAKSQHQQKLKELESSWEKKHIACVKEIDSLKTKLSEKEDYYKQEFETIQTKADRDIFDLRRKLDKIDMSYQEQIEKMQLKHEKELEKVREEADRRIQQCELNAQHQVGASRTTIELVKEQMQRESQQQLQQLSEHHRRQLEEQWEQLVQERDDAIAMIEQKHRSSMEKLRNELDSIYKGKNSRETELMDTLSHMRQELSGKTTQIGSLETNVEELQGNLEVLNCEVNNKAQQISKVMKEGEEVLRQREQQLQETFQSQLEEMNDRHRKEIGAWQSNVDELHKKIASLAKRDENKDNSSAAKKIEELAKQLKEKEQQIATLTKEKHLYQLELMNKDKESVQAKQRRKGGRGRHQGGRGQRC